MTAVLLRSWGCRLLKGGVGWRGGAGIFRFPPKLTVSHFQMEVEVFFFPGPELHFSNLLKKLEAVFLEASEKRVQ